MVFKKKEMPKFPGIMKDEPSISDELERCLPSKEEIKEIAKLIKKITGLEVGDKFEKGMLKIKFINNEEAIRIRDEAMLAEAKRLVLEPSVMKRVKKSIMTSAYHEFEGDTSTAFFNPFDDTIYMLKSNIEKVFRENNPEGLMVRNYSRKEIIIDNVIHEALHKVSGEHNTLISDRPLQVFVGTATLTSQLSKISENDPKKPALVREAGEFIDTMRSRYAYSEAFAYYSCHKVLRELGYKGRFAFDLVELEMSEPRVAVGIRFLQEIERRGKNPFSYTINHLPLGMRHLEHPDEYLKDREEGKV